MQMAAIYARVSSEQQREAHTIASQTAALIELAGKSRVQNAAERARTASRLRSSPGRSSVVPL